MKPGGVLILPANVRGATDSGLWPNKGTEAEALRDGLGPVLAVGRTGGFELRVHVGEAAATLGNTRGATRLFGSIDSITTLLQRLGVTAFEVDISHYAPAPLRTLRAELSGATTQEHTV